MEPNTADINEAVSQLLSHWYLGDQQVIRNLLTQWQTKLNVKITLNSGRRTTLVMRMDFSQIYLRSMNSVPTVILNDRKASQEEIAQDIRHLFKEEASPGQIPLIIALTDGAWQTARKVTVEKGCILLAYEETENLLGNPNPLEAFKIHLWNQIPRRRLIPYSIIHPARFSMFFGRGNELRRLQEEEEVSFAIAGPGRIGKTSLALQHRHNTLISGDSRAKQIYYVDFYECGDKTDDGIARFLAMHIEPGRRSDRMTASGLANFMRYQNARHGGRVELILDEVDEVCNSEAFALLGNAAKQNLCRLILCGKGELLKMMLNTSSTLYSRVQLMRLEPLDRISALGLLVKPLSDLNINFEQNETRQDILDLTGSLPHLIQFYGERLARLVLDRDKHTISNDDVNLLQWDWATAQFFTAPLQNLTDFNSRFVALSLLDKPRVQWKAADMLTYLRSMGLTLTHMELLNICNALVINNLLTWSNGTYVVANQALPIYARRLGYLDSELRESQRAVQVA